MTEAQLLSVLTRLENATQRLEILSKYETVGASSQTSAGPSAASVSAFDSLLTESFASYLAASKKIGGLVSDQATVLNDAVHEIRRLVQVASVSKKPADISPHLKNLTQFIGKIAELKDKNRSSPLFSHLSAVADGAPALGWVAVEPTPAPFVNEMKEAAQFYANKVIKEFKEKDKSHVEWVNLYLAFLAELIVYIKKWHTTGLSWNPKGGDASAAPSTSSAPAPTVAIAKPSTAAAAAPAKPVGNLFGELAGKDAVTAGLRKVDKSEMTHKNPELRATSVVKAAATPAKSPAGAPKGPAKLALEGNKWVVENQFNNENVVISETEIRHVVYIYGCQNSTITIKGKVNAITLDSCKKVALVIDTVVSSVDTVNCKSVQIQITGTAPTALVDKTDGYQLYLSDSARAIEIFASKSSEMNVLTQQNGGDFIEKPVCEQFKTVVDKNGNLKTEPVEHKE